jgi:hypothetical protein
MFEIASEVVFSVALRLGIFFLCVSAIVAIYKIYEHLTRFSNYRLRSEYSKRVYQREEIEEGLDRLESMRLYFEMANRYKRFQRRSKIPAGDIVTASQLHKLLLYEMFIKDRYACEDYKGALKELGKAEVMILSLKEKVVAYQRLLEAEDRYSGEF